MNDCNCAMCQISRLIALARETRPDDAILIEIGRLVEQERNGKKVFPDGK